MSADPRWKSVDHFISTESMNTEAVETPQAKQWVHKMTARMNSAPLAVSGATALVVLVILLIIRPPFVYTRKNSRIHPHMHVETISAKRLSAWVAIAFFVTLVGSDVLAMC